MPGTYKIFRFLNRREDWKSHLYAVAYIVTYAVALVIAYADVAYAIFYAVAYDLLELIILAYFYVALFEAFSAFYIPSLKTLYLILP